MIQLITFEGGEGSGKSTLAKRFAEYIGAPLYREPGGTDVGEKIREILVRGSTPLSSMTEMLLMSAARSHLVEHLRTLKVPYVVLDRYFDSTLVYQVLAGQMDMPMEEVLLLQMRLTKSLVPARTYWIDVEPAVGLKRSFRQDNQETRFEDKGAQFHENVRQGYRQLVSQFAHRMVTIDSTTHNADQVFEITRKDFEQWTRA